MKSRDFTGTNRLVPYIQLFCTIRRKVHITLTQKSLCFISDDLNHDTCFVYEVIKQTVNHIKEEIFTTPSLMHYFSDGGVGQYKNYKNFINICLHEKDFDVKCIWSFFATSHGKSPWDGLGGTLKCLTARASLQRTLSNQLS
jgi:hypothetical protein